MGLICYNNNMSENIGLPVPSVDIGGLRGPDDLFHPIEYDLKSELTERDPNETYRIFAIRYKDSTEFQGDGALFEVDPGTATPVMYIKREGYQARRQVIEGDGRVLSILPSGEMRVFDVDANSGKIIEEGPGWVDCWIAGQNGMKIIDMSKPGFQLDFEVSIKVDDPSLPSEYWKQYHQLVKS